jgi:nucleoside-diphosphate-sugar epimerase
MKRNVLVIGAGGQIGIELTAALRAEYGAHHVIAADVAPSKDGEGPQLTLDVLDQKAVASAIEEYEVDEVYLLAALLSATAEKNPEYAWKLNMESLLTLLELARYKKISKLYWPSSIAVFGPGTPRHNTPQHTIMDPSTVYGISKLAGERWCEYYHKKFGVDVRSLRYPGLIGHKSAPGGGTTDYAVHIFHEAIQKHSYTCFLNAETELPMMMMEDAIRATLMIMKAPAEKIQIRSSYNLAGLSFTPAQLANEIKKQIPDFAISYAPDFRQQIADSWPASISDEDARKHWGWAPEFDLSRMVNTMLQAISASYQSA